MPPRRRPRGFSPEIQLVSGGGRDDSPLHRRLYRQLREHILSGALEPGARLPSARTLAGDLEVSRNTVEAAIGQLVAEGFVERRVGAGTVVAASLGETAPFRAPHPNPNPTPVNAPEPRLSTRGERTARLGRAEIAADREPGPCSTNVHRFPREAWNRHLVRCARRGGAALLGPVSGQGLLELRKQIAEYARLARGLRCDSAQVFVVDSTQQALDLVARLLLDPGDRVAIEDPGYPSARAAFLAAGAELNPVAVDDEGLVAEKLAAARLLYLTPSHQFPLGVTLSLARRLTVLRWAAATGAWVIEDDYDSEFRYDGRPLAALQGLDSGGRVIYLGTYNKVLFPGLRLAYLILPPDLVAPFTAARRILDGFSAPLPQAVLAEFLASGQFAAYLRQARLYYAGCRDRLLGLLSTSFGDRLPLGPSGTGLHLVAHLPPGTDDAAIVRALPPLGLDVAPLSRYHLAPSNRAGLLLSYGAAPPEGVATDVAALARVLEPVLPP